MQIDQQLGGKKQQLLIHFRKKADEAKKFATSKSKDKKKCVGIVTKALNEAREELIAGVVAASQEGWQQEDVIRAVLMTTYACNVIMLDARNSIWPYEYMAFSRRIGEIWEPFCKLCFRFPIDDLEFVSAPSFVDFRNKLKQEIRTELSNLDISTEAQATLLKRYEDVWTLVTSGEIKLGLDLHFEKNGETFNIDFKSGFGSNEKGNTNRLLMVASIYRKLDEDHNCILLVRASEDLNNHYFQTLKNSDVWEAYCGATAYDKISEYTGFNLSKWIDENICWLDDLDQDTTEHFQEHNLVHYLEW